MTLYPYTPPTSTVERGGQPALGATAPAWVGTVLIIGVVAGIGYLIFKGLSARQRRLDKIAEKEGSRGVLRYEAGEAAIGLMSAGTTALLDRSSRRNPRRKRRK